MTNSLTEKLKPYVEAIEKSASHGNKKAKQIIDLYHMHCDCPSDPGAPALCSAAFNEWLKSR